MAVKDFRNDFMLTLSHSSSRTPIGGISPEHKVSLISGIRKFICQNAGIGFPDTSIVAA